MGLFRALISIVSLGTVPYDKDEDKETTTTEHHSYPGTKDDSIDITRHVNRNWGGHGNGC